VPFVRDRAPAIELHSSERAALLGPLALAVVPALSLLLLVQHPVWDVDVFWQLKLGELILAHGGPIVREPFAANHLGQPLPSLAWGAQALYAAIRRLGGWPLLRTADALFWLGGFWAAGWAARRSGACAMGVALALALAMIATLFQASLRPQSLAALGFGLVVALTLLPVRPLVRVPLMALLLVGWQNLHPSVAVAAVWLGALAGVRWLAVLRRRAGPMPWEPSLLAAMAALAMFATPEGTGILAVSAANAAMSRMIGVSEWLPLWDPLNHVVAVPIVATALFALWLVHRSRRFAPDELVAALVLLGLTALSSRFVLFWAIASIPVVARAVPPSPERRLPRLAAVLPVVLVALLGVLTPVRFAPDLPLAAIARLRESGVTGTVYAHYPWGGPVIDAGYPAWHVAYDGRYYRYTREEWQAYYAAGQGQVPLAAIERRWHPSAWLLEPGWNAPLIAALRADRARWRELPGESGAVAFVPAR